MMKVRLEALFGVLWLCAMIFIITGSSCTDTRAASAEEKKSRYVTSDCKSGPSSLGATCVIEVDGATYVVVLGSQCVAICPTLETLKRARTEAADDTF